MLLGMYGWKYRRSRSGWSLISFPSDAGSSDSALAICDGKCGMGYG